MIKIPGTKEGMPAIRAATAEGININITLLFAIEAHDQVIDAYLSGLEDRVKAGKPIDKIASVASFFVSRVDTKVDKMLEDLLSPRQAPARSRPPRGRRSPRKAPARSRPPRERRSRRCSGKRRSRTRGCPTDCSSTDSNRRDSRR